jgi:hypothetical protein
LGIGSFISKEHVNQTNSRLVGALLVDLVEIVVCDAPLPLSCLFF